MYNLSKEQIESVESFIGKIGDSIVKSQYEKWLAEVRPTSRATPEQMETFVSYANALPHDLQNFPQSFAHAVKNTPEAEKREALNGTVAASDLVTLTNESIEGVKNVSSPENKEETLHKLNTVEGSKGGEPLSPKAKGGDAVLPKKSAEKKSTPTKKEAAPKKTAVREGAKLNPTKKVEPKSAKPVVVLKKK